jgi:hypothetical protein
MTTQTSPIEGANTVGNLPTQLTTAKPSASAAEQFTTTTATREPTALQTVTLLAYAAQHGRTWKTKLHADWRQSGSRTFDGEWAPLQQLRNTLGPSWLESYVLPFQAAETSAENAQAGQQEPSKVLRFENLLGKTRVRNGVAFEPKQDGPSVFNADVVPGVSIRIHGTNFSGQPFDLTFRMGDSAIYGSFNLVYTGEIVGITAKQVKINPGHRESCKVFDLYGFVLKNYAYDAERISKNNADWSD